MLVLDIIKSDESASSSAFSCNEPLDNVVVARALLEDKEKEYVWAKTCFSIKWSVNVVVPSYPLET